MTKEGIEEIIRRYSNLERYVKDGETVASFYIGNRKQTVMITEAVRTVYRIVDEIYEREDKWMRISLLTEKRRRMRNARKRYNYGLRRKRTA